MRGIMQTAEIFILWVVIAVFVTVTGAVENVYKCHQYGRERLLELRTVVHSQPSNYPTSRLKWFEEVFVNEDEGQQRNSSTYKGKRRRGRRGGIRARVRRRGIRTPLPTVIFGNVQSVRNKIDELAANCKFLSEYRESALIGLSETWLQENDPDSTYDIDGFKFIRSDRRDLTKQRGGGVGLYVNERWCSQVTVKETYCSDDIEYLVVSCRPFYLPREFNNVYIIVVYITTSADVKMAGEKLQNCVNKWENSNANGVNIIMGDFNKCEFDRYVPTYDQCVQIPTCGNNTLDKLYCSVRDGYRAFQKPKLGESVHNMVHCIPMYKQKIKREKCKKIMVREWSEENTMSLQGCFECTDWCKMYDQDCDFNENVDVFTSYVQFCVDMLIPTREVKQYPNNKPWVTKDIKEYINEKKRIYHTGDRDSLRALHTQLKSKITEGKRVFKEKVEHLFKTNQSKDAWKGVKVLSGYQTKRAMADPTIDLRYVNELNTFYARFDRYDFREECDSILRLAKNRNDERILVSHDEVVRSVKRIKCGKACGPDQVGAKVLRSCTDQLAKPLLVLFQASLDQCTVPYTWKMSEIIPIPKTKFPKIKNDLRPIALTSLIMKCLEHIVKRHLCSQVRYVRDPLQFAYSEGKSVQDAVVTLIHNVSQHLDKANSQVRVLYVDFSSAFNTIQPHILMSKLLQLKVNSRLVVWLHSYLLDRPQFTKVNNIKSDVIYTNTGVPQGCVLAPILFILYTNDCVSSFDSCSIIKYADDTAVLGKISSNHSAEYLAQIKKFNEWCQSNYLNLNVKKTKEMIFDFRKNKCLPENIVINNEPVERVTQYKYLGVVIDNQLTGTQNTDMVYKKGQQRLHFMRVLNNLQINNNILDLFYKSVIESVLGFSIAIWYGKLKVKDKGKLNKIVRTARKLKAKVDSLDGLYNKNVIQMVKKIMADEQHPLYSNYVFLRSGKRLAVPKQHTDRFKKSFVPTSVKIFNNFLEQKQ